MSDFKVGDRVRWTSQSAGTVKPKTGEVVEVVPAGRRVYPSRGEVPTGLRVAAHTVPGVGGPRDHVSYIIRSEGKGARLYWPRVAALKVHR